MKGSKKEPGVIPLTLKDLFSLFKDSETKNGKKINRVIKINYVEIYNEKINDLLNSENTNLKIRMNEDKSLVIHGLSQLPAKNEKEALDML